MKRLTNPVESEIVIQKSRFLTYLFPMETLEEVETKQKELKKLHRKANHVCYAYRLGLCNVVGHFSDDGEPSQTAGLPMFTVIEGEDVTNLGAFVVRYFGGIKLGTGGLVRAYTEAVRIVLAEAEFEEIEKYRKVQLKYGYHHHNQVQNLISDLPTGEPSYQADVTWTIYYHDEMILTKLRDVTDGTIQMNDLGEVLIAQTKRGILDLGGSNERID